MPVSTSCIELYANSCAAASPNCLETQQLAGVAASIEQAAIGCSVANTSALPSAGDNEGRWIFVEDIGAYRFSNGIIWSNEYSSSARISYRLLSTGSNALGALGINETLNICTSTPVRELTLSENWCQISTREFSTQAVKTDGTLWNWGFRYGLSADSSGALIDRSSPVQEACSATNWCFSAGGGRSTGSSSGGIKTDGSLWMWGFNRCGDLGVGVISGFTTFTTPIQEVSSSTIWSELSLFSQTCPGAVALKTDGTFWGWGRNLLGSLGTNDIICYSSPVQEISSSTNWCKVAAGSALSTGIKTDGTLWSAGSGICGQLATNSIIICYSSPVQEISSSTNWSLVYQSNRNGQHAIKTDGTLWSWGSDVGGAIGDGIFAGSMSSPVQEITSSTNWCIVSPGQLGSMAIKTDSTLWGWGFNSCGMFVSDQIPISANVYSPTQISEIVGWCAVSVAPCHAALILAQQIGFNEP